MTAPEIFPGSVKNSYPFSTSRTEKPCPIASEMARSPVETDNLLDVFPITTTGPNSINQNHVVGIHPIADGAGFLTTA